MGMEVKHGLSMEKNSYTEYEGILCRILEGKEVWFNNYKDSTPANSIAINLISLVEF